MPLKRVSNEDAWLDSLGEVGVKFEAWRAAIIADLGGEDTISSMERAIVELAVKTYLIFKASINSCLPCQ